MEVPGGPKSGANLVLGGFPFVLRLLEAPLTTLLLLDVVGWLLFLFVGLKLAGGPWLVPGAVSIGVVGWLALLAVGL